MNLLSIDYKKRRQNVLDEIGNSSLLVLSQPVAIRNYDVEHTYRQHSFMHYLTGFAEPNCALLILGHKPVGERNIIFVQKRDPAAERWTGKRLGFENACETLKIDQAFDIDQLWDKLPELLLGTDALYYNFGACSENDVNLIKTLKLHRRKKARTWCSNLTVIDSDIISGKLRLKKDEVEIQRMRQAADISRKAFEIIYKTVKAGMSERMVRGLIDGEYLKLGADMVSFDTIVAAGANACYLHYVENNDPLLDSQLVLIDTGVQYQYYASDVTRTFPVGKTFTPAQKDLYEIVLQAELDAISKAVLGSSLVNVHQAAVSTICDGLLNLGILKGSKSEIVEKGLYKKLFPHNTSHWIGMDVHDVGDYVDRKGSPLAFEAGMYFSVEPGVYCDPSDDTIPDKYKGIGIRIEDDVLITAKGNEVITDGIMKTVKELESRI